jgi:hypothetical protein
VVIRCWPSERVTGDEAYGDNTRLRARCQSRGLNYVLAVSCDHPLALAGAKTRAGHAFAALNADAWQRHSRGQGAKGERWYDWAWIHLAERECMLARRSISDPTDVAAGPPDAPGGELGEDHDGPAIQGARNNRTITLRP